MKQTYLTKAMIGSMVIFSSIAIASSTFNNLDFEKSLNNGDIYFVPFKNSNPKRGYIWFKHYFYKYTHLDDTENQENTTIETLIVSFYPTSYEDGSYKIFANTHDLMPRNEYRLPDDAILCEPTEQLESLSEHFSYFSLARMPQAFPRLCSLRIRYRATTEQRKALIDLLETKQLMKVDVRIVNPNTVNKDIVMLDIPKIMLKLVDLGLLEDYMPQANMPQAEVIGQEVSLTQLKNHIHDLIRQGTSRPDNTNDFIDHAKEEFFALFSPVPGQDDRVYITTDNAKKTLEVEFTLPTKPMLVIQ
jgi:hypothetical protein